MTILFDATFEENMLYQKIPKTGFEYLMNGNGTLEVLAAAAHNGSLGLRVTPVSGSFYPCMGGFQILNPTGQRQNRQRFWFHPNSITLTSGQYVRIARNLFPWANLISYAIRLGYSGTSYRINAGIYNGETDDTWVSDTAWYDITNAWHRIEFAFKTGSPGSVQLWVDGNNVGIVTATNPDACCFVAGFGVGYPGSSGFTFNGNFYLDDIRITDTPDIEIGA